VRRTAIVALLVGAVVAVAAAPGFVKLDEPNSDGLFYEVEKLRVQGHDEAEATRVVFEGPLARQTAAIEDEPDEPRVLDPAWVEYSKRFYERRWLVPVLAAAVEPVVGDAPGRALRVASLIGYVLIAPVLFLLLRRRFSERLSAALALICTLAPPVYKWSLGMRVDSWGLMLESLGLLAAVLVKDRGLRWLPLWVVAVAALSITRDATVILVLAVLWLLWVERRDLGARRTNLILLGTGIAAALPVFFLGGTPVRENLAYVISGFKIPEDDSWSFVASGYLDQLWRTISTDLTYPVDFAIPVAVVLYAGLAVTVAALVALVARPSRGDHYFSLFKAALPGSALLLLLANNPQAYRLELVLVPTVAVGLATLASSDDLGARTSVRKADADDPRGGVGRADHG
jgi:Dolichyl-phosphate-mannose-protein mannosyltransferase